MNIAALVAIATKCEAGDFANRFPHPMLVVRRRSGETDGVGLKTALDWKQGTRIGGASFNTQRNGPGERRAATPAIAIAEASVEPIEKSKRNPFEGMITIGRAPNNDVVLHLSSVSKLHAYMRREGAKWVLRDKASSNGTFVNGTRINAEEPVVIEDGTYVLFGPDADCLF